MVVFAWNLKDESEKKEENRRSFLIFHFHPIIIFRYVYVWLCVRVCMFYVVHRIVSWMLADSIDSMYVYGWAHYTLVLCRGCGCTVLCCTVSYHTRKENGIYFIWKCGKIYGWDHEWANCGDLRNETIFSQVIRMRCTDCWCCASRYHFFFSYLVLFYHFY